jgi:hypothetical protein
MAACWRPPVLPALLALLAAAHLTTATNEDCSGVTPVLQVRAWLASAELTHLLCSCVHMYS